MKKLKTLSPAQVARALKPRNPVLAALATGQGAKAGRHQKSGRALRRAAKLAVRDALDEKV